MCVFGGLLWDEQADFSHVHQFGPVLHRGRADVGDDVGQGGVLLGGQGDQHADRVAVIRQLDHLIFQTLGRGDHAWASTGGFQRSRSDGIRVIGSDNEDSFIIFLSSVAKAK